MHLERRASRRHPVRLFCNQYIDGTPVLGEAVELSLGGAVVRRVSGPDVERASYSIELGSPDRPDQTVWLCAVPVRKEGQVEALRFVGTSVSDKVRLAHILYGAA